MYDIAYGFAHTYFPLPSTERMRIEVARRGAAAVLVGSTFHTTVRCSLTPPPTPRRSTAHCTAEANGQHIQWKSRPGCCTSSLAWLGRCCLGLHSDFEFLTSRSSFSTPPALHYYSALVYYIYTLQMYSVEGAISPCHLPGQKRSSLAIHNGGTTYTLVHGLKSSSGLDCVV